MANPERVQYKFMIPAGLKRELEEAASQSRRSLSAEIIMRLYDSLSDLPLISDDPLQNELSKLEAERFSKSYHLKELVSRISAIDEDIKGLKQAISERDTSPDDS